jgi:hypothetical protein
MGTIIIKNNKKVSTNSDKALRKINRNKIRIIRIIRILIIKNNSSC